MEKMSGTKDCVNNKYAVCIYGQLRAACTVYENLNTFLINELEADLYLLVQDTNIEIDSNLFNTENKVIYQSPDVRNIFLNYTFLTQRNNYIMDGCLQVYYNFHKIDEMFGDIFEKKYEYIILTRSDYLHLFPFPNILNISDKDIFWCYDGHEWGGINITLMCISSKYIREYLSSFFNYLQDHNNVQYLNTLDINAEQFAKLIFDKFNWKLGKIEPNAFITATNLNELTTWATISYCPDNNVYYKYPDQLRRAFDALKKYKKNNGWILRNTEYITVDYTEVPIFVYVIISVVGLFILITVFVVYRILKNSLYRTRKISPTKELLITKSRVLFDSLFFHKNKSPRSRMNLHKGFIRRLL
jgi:hypothetical protein